MQLFLDYEKLFQQRLNEYLGRQYEDLLIDVLRKLHSNLELAKERRKKQVVTDCQESQEEREERELEDEEEENDSFIDDGDGFENTPAQQSQAQEIQDQMDFEFNDETEMNSLV